MSTSSREFLKKVQSALMQMHRYLLQSLKADQEHKLGKALTPVDWLQMIITDPNYAWLKPLTSLMSDLDALIDNYEVTEDHLKIARQELDELFLIMSEDSSDFNFKYSQVARTDSDVMIYHAQLRQMILALPKSDQFVETTELRKTWHKRPRNRT